MKFSTIPEAFIKTCERFGDTKPAFVFKNPQGVLSEINYLELKSRVENFALGLIELGIRKDDKIGIVSENRLEWIIADFASISLGAVTVPIFPTLTAKQIEYIYNDCGVSTVIVSNSMQLRKILEIKDNLTNLRHIIIMNDDYSPKDISTKSMSDVSNWGKQALENTNNKNILINSISKIKSDDLLTLIYTSGTTGNPKGVMLSHKNILANFEGITERYYFSEKDSSVSYLPLSHSYERATGYYSLFFYGATIGLADSIESLMSFIQEIKPTVMTTVPRFLETAKKKIYNAIEKDKVSKQKIFHWAINIGIKYVRRKFAGKSTLSIEMQYKLADKLVFSKLREKFGGRLRFMVSGGAPLNEDLQEFFVAIGIPIVQGYGLTEASPVVSANLLDAIEIGTIGKPLFNVQVKFGEDGEILVKGDNVMKGYWNDEIATQEAIDEDGWLYTGDIGVLTPSGNIKITDRKKNIFVSSGGKNIAPQPIESLLAQSKYIDHVILIGERREYCTAIISPNFEQLESLAKEFEINFNDKNELIVNPKIISHLKREIDYIQRDLAKYEKVRKFVLLSEPFTIENGELSPKMSIRRHVVEKKYSEIIEQLYSSDM
ncbi:MAG: AMP-dependent synthetase/ligase [Candidatus Kapaibacteriota bacterium]